MRFFREQEGSVARDLGLLAIIIGTLFFQALGKLPLIDPDEGRYIEIPREMLERGDFITPTLNYVKYFEKPPLHYWLNAFSLKIFGESEFAARVPGTLCGLLTVLVTYYLGRRLFDRRTGMFAATLLGTAMGFMVQARINFTDMTLTFCLTGAFACFMLALKEEEKRKALWFYLFYLFMALAVLAKGLIGIVLPGGVIFFYTLFTRNWRLLKEMRLFTGGLLFLLVCAPWFVLVSLKNPEFPHFFFIREHFQRFLTQEHHRYQPLWFFVPVLILTLLPWSPFLPAALTRAWRERKGEWAFLFLMLWAGIIFAFFSKSSSKLVPYILPVFPPLALMIGNWFATVPEGSSPKRHGRAIAVFLIVVGSGILAYTLWYPKPELTPEIGIVVGGLLFCQGVAAYAGGWSGDPVRLFVALAGSAWFFLAAAPPVVYGRVAQDRSCKELAQAIKRLATPETRIACFNGYEQGIAFYTHRRVIVIGDPDELEFGSKQGDNSAWFVPYEDAPKLWNSGTPLLMTIKQSELEPFRQVVGTPVTVVATQGKRLLVTNKDARNLQGR